MNEVWADLIKTGLESLKKGALTDTKEAMEFTIATLIFHLDRMATALEGIDESLKPFFTKVAELDAATETEFKKGSKTLK